MNDQEIEESYPLTPLQSGMLFHSLYNSEAGMYIQQMVGELHEHLNTSAFQQAWQQMGERYAVLRTSFLLGPSGQSLQVVHRRAHFPFDARDWRDLSVSEQRHRLDDYLKADRRRGFVLTQVPLMRLVLFRLGEAEYCLVWTSHHALLDGRSRLLLLQELFALYEAYCSGDSPRLETPRSFKDHVDWLSNQDFSMAQRFWRSELEGVTLPTPIGIDGVGVSETEEDESYGSKAIRLSGRLTLELKNLAEKHELTLNTLLQGAWALLLGHYCGKDDVVFGTTRACRRSALKDAESMIGLFINTVPLRVRIPPEIPLIPWLKKLRLQWIGLRDYEHTPLSQIQDCIPDRGSSPLFESLLVFENFELNSALRSHSKGFENREFRLLGRTNYPLVITGCFDQQILLRAEYDSPRFSAKSIEHLLGHLETLLEAMVAVPSRQISDLPFLTEKEKEQLLVGWNATSVQYPREHCIHDLFESRVKTAPNAIALKFGERVLTYQQLNANANRLAHYLKKAGIGTGSMVGICMERTPNLTVAMLGVLKAGGAYVPIDPAYPPERQAFMLDDTGTRLLLTEAAQQESLTRHVAKLVGLDTDWNLIAKESDQDPTCDAQADSLAYVIYTSGSTGRPKGVAVTHRGIVRLLFGIDYVRLGPNERILHLSSISFDASTFEVWGALLHGAQLVIFPDRIPTLRSLEYELKTHPISLLWLTSSLFNLVIDENPEILSGVRQIVTGGEALSVRHIARALKVLPSTRIINGYGPTENTTFTCCYPIPREFNPHSISVPIGRPISNTRTFVLDSHLRPLPIGVTGELYTSGEGLAQGYLNQPLMTAEKFIPDPFSGKPGARMYRTGDMARYLPDGNLEFRGRRDEQVKIRGFRIELGEIEATLSEHPSVLQTVATANQGPDGVKSLVAYFVARGGQPPPVTKELRQFLEKKLPEYMIPARFVHLDSIPLTSNGKVDRTRLPAPGTASPDSGKIFVAARNSVEKRLLEIWSQILKKERIGIHDNFFDLGGESLLAVSMASQVRSILGIDLPVRKIFDEPTIAGLAEWIEREQANGQQVEEAPLRAVPRDREIPLSFKQEFCWSRKSIYFDRELLNICRIFRLRGNLQTANLQRAFNELIVRHESLRTSIALSPKGQPIQVINPEQEIVVPVVDLGFLAPADQQIEARHLAEEEGALIFKPNISPLLRAKLIRLSEDENWLVFVISHLIADGWSLRVLFRELGTIYSAYCRGEEPHLSPLPIQFADYAVWQRQHFQGQRSEELVSYWRHRLGKSLSSLKLPYDHSRPSTPTYLARRESVTIPAALQRSFSKLVKEEQTTEFVGLLAAFKLLLYLYTGQSDIVVGLPVSNRDQVETADVIGWFSNMVFCRSDLSGDPTFLSLLNRVRKTVLEDFQHRGLCIELLQLNVPPTDGSIDPISQCRFVEAPDFEIDLPMEKLQVELLSREQVSMANELRLYVGHKSSNGIELKVDYSTDLFAPETVRLMMRRYRELLEQIVTNPAKHISEYSLDSSPGKKETSSRTHTANENISAIPMASLLQATHSSGEAERSPLSFAQQRLWFFDQLEPGKSAYNVNQLLRLRGPLQVEALERAFNAIIDRHAALRTTFATQNGEPVQVIARSLEITIPIIDFERFEVGRRRIEAQQRAEKEAERPFDLSRGPLIRVTLLRLAPIEHLLLLSMHHIVSDAWSMLVLQKELSAYYSGFISGEPVRLPPLPIQYADYAIWQRQRLQGKNLKADLDYWKQHLSGCASVLRLPTDFPRPEIQTYQGGRQKSTLKRSLLDSLETLSRREGCSLFMTLLAAFNTLLHRLTRQENIVVGVPVAGRSRPETEGLIGFFVNTLALRNKISGNPTFLTLLRNVRDVALDAFAHQELPFDKLVEELNPERSLSHTPLFQVALNVWALPPYKPHLPDLSVEAVTRSEAQSKFDLTLYAWEEDRGFTLSLVYNASLFGQTRMAEFVRQLQCLLEQITLDPTKPISSYSLVTPQFKSLLPDPTTELPEPFYEPVPRQFVRQVQRTPDHPAICQGRHTWKYQELYDSARQSAWALIESGVERGEVVAVTGPKSYGLVASMMGVLMSGGVFLSLDPNLPPNRQRLLIQESHARRILCIGQLGQDDDWMRRATPGGILSVNSDTGEVQGVPRISNWDSQDLPLLSPNDPAYIFFTSGTSGLPKGVLGCHKGVSHFLT
ncbi:MAG TPA: amino acid adenylation domain-containing protein, partial [Terriglobia bacterium]|nr:amino acid adenylation domain-containing protein [Terriglobia bacterium]